MGSDHLNPSYRDRFRASDVNIEIQADHARRRRVPRGHELVRQIMRGQPLQMVEDVERSWRIVAQRHCVGVIRHNRDGSFSCGVVTEHCPRAPNTALRRVACRVLRIDPDTVGDGRPGPGS